MLIISRPLKCSNYPSCGESCPDIDRGFFVAFYYHSIPQAVVDLYRKGLKTFALDGVRARDKVGHRFFVPAENKALITSCCNHFTKARKRSLSPMPIQKLQSLNANCGTPFKNLCLLLLTQTIRKLRKGFIAFIRRSCRLFLNSISHLHPLHDHEKARDSCSSTDWIQSARPVLTSNPKSSGRYCPDG